MIRSAPRRCAASTPQSPTAPSPTTTTVDPARTPAEIAAWCPVPITSDEREQVGDHRVLRNAGRGDERAVGKWRPDELTLATVDKTAFLVVRAPPLAVVARRGDPVPAMHTGAVTDRERRDHEVAGPYGLDRRSDLLNDPDELVADPGRLLRAGSHPDSGHRSDPQTQLATTRTSASVGCCTIGSGTCSNRTSPGPWMSGRAHAGTPVAAEEWTIDVQRP